MRACSVHPGSWAHLGSTSDLLAEEAQSTYAIKPRHSAANKGDRVVQNEQPTVMSVGLLGRDRGRDSEGNAARPRLVFGLVQKGFEWTIRSRHRVVHLHFCTAENAKDPMVGHTEWKEVCTGVAKALLNGGIQPKAGEGNTRHRCGAGDVG
jgi:hypothetical protein